MISQTAEYALRAMVRMATADSKQTVEQIAVDTQVPVGYLSKVLQSLTKAGFLRSQRGIGGGFTLAKPADTVTIYDVVQAVDPIRRITECPLGLTAHRHQLCPLHKGLDDAMALIEAQFRGATIAAMMDTALEVENAPSVSMGDRQGT
jgi:Rrf2 family nitric oxide-sensitive transcriptional repressor